MKFHRCAVEGAFEIESEPLVDERGRFMRTWCVDEFVQHGIDFSPVQGNMGLSLRKGTIRGLHYQIAPALEAKLVRCTRGVLFDVVADLRPGSSTYRGWHGVELTPDNGIMLYVPEGCAHGCLSLEDDTEFQYLASSRFAPECARGRRYDDPALAIVWPEPVKLVSDQDRNWPLLNDRED